MGVSSEPSDGALLLDARAGDEAAFGRLWVRHVDDARRAARAITQSFDADDVVAEAFTAIWKALRAGKGPSDIFRPYLLATVRNVIAGWGRARREDTPGFVVETVDFRSADRDVFARADASLVMAAFESLPERWREVLWMTEVEALLPAEVGERLGMSANGAAALAYRAREGLRQAWIQAHVDPAAADGEHQWVLEHIGQHARGTISPRNKARFDAHFEDCEECQGASRIAIESSASFTSVMLPLAVGVLTVAGAGIVVDSLSSSSAYAAEISSPSDHDSSVVVRRRRPTVLLAAAAAVAVIVPVSLSVLSSASLPSTSQQGSWVSTPSSAPQTPSASESPSVPTEAAPSGSPQPTATAPGPYPLETTEPDRTPPEARDAPPHARTPLQGDAATGMAVEMSSIDTAGGLLAPVVSGTAGAGAVVVVSIGRTSITTSAGADGRWQTPPIDVRAGTFTVTATADGSATSPVNVTVSSPVVSVTQRAGKTTVTIRGGANTGYRISTGDATSQVETDGSGTVTVDVTASGGDLMVCAVSGERTGPQTVIPVPTG